MPWRLSDDDFTGQRGLMLTGGWPITNIYPAYAVVGEEDWLVRVRGLEANRLHACTRQLHLHQMQMPQTAGPARRTRRAVQCALQRAVQCMHHAAWQRARAAHHATRPTRTSRATPRTPSSAPMQRARCSAPDAAHRAARQVVGLEYNDYVYFMPRREHCDDLKALEDNAGWDRYSRCACAGAMISIEGGEVRLVRVRVS